MVEPVCGPNFYYCVHGCNFRHERQCDASTPFWDNWWDNFKGKCTTCGQPLEGDGRWSGIPHCSPDHTFCADGCGQLQFDQCHVDMPFWDKWQKKCTSCPNALIEPNPLQRPNWINCLNSPQEDGGNDFYT